MNRIKTAAALAALLAIPSADALAQACIGVPVGSAGFAVAGSVGFPENATRYGVTGTANLIGPIAVQAGFERTTLDEQDGIEVDEAFNSFGGRVAVKMPLPQLSVCPVAGATYGTFSVEESGFEFSMKALTIPVGVGVGTTVPAGVASLTAYAIPQIVYTRLKTEDDFFGESTDSSTDFAAEAGVVLSAGRLFGGVSVNKFFADEAESEDGFSVNSDAVFSVQVGFRVGGL